MESPASSTEAQDCRRARVAPFYAQIVEHYTQAQQDAIRLLYETAQRHLDTGGGSRCAKLLLGLYNGRRFPFDLTDLRCLDSALYLAARIVIDMDARHTFTEVHELLNAIYADGRNVGGELERWAFDLKWGKRCKRDQLPSDVGPKWTAAGTVAQ
jgi:hypothetical protein